MDDNNDTPKDPKLKQWLKRYPRCTFQFIPASGSWLNAAENFFSTLTRKRMRYGAFNSICDLQATSDRDATEHNAKPNPTHSSGRPPSYRSSSNPTDRVDQPNEAVR